MPTPPRVTPQPVTLSHHGHDRIDPYYWLNQRTNDDVLQHLRAENEYYRERLTPLSELSSTIFEEIKARIDETDLSVPVRRGPWWYFDRTIEGLDYPISVRTPAVNDTPPVVLPGPVGDNEQVVLDENEIARGHDFCSIGVLSVSPDHQWVAVGVDFEGNERHRLTVRSLGDLESPRDEIDDVYYGFAWANDNEHFFYTRVDDAMRPWQVWRHRMGTKDDVLVFQEDDARFNVGVQRTRDGAFILVTTNSSSTTETHLIRADDPTTEREIFEARRTGIEYGLEHTISTTGTPWWLKITNEDATDFRLLARSESSDAWREIIGERPGCRLDGVDAFVGHLAISERRDGCASVRLIALGDEEDPFNFGEAESSRPLSTGVFPDTVSLGANPNFETTHVRVVMTSLVTPRLVADVELATGNLIERKRQRVLGSFNAEDYVTLRRWVSASDNVEIPVSLVVKRSLLNQTSEGPLVPIPLVLYGYGSYEISIDPSFSSVLLSLLDRGIGFAIAHIRGGGEMGRKWYEMGRLAQKPTTFSDFVSVARDLVSSGWTTSDQLCARGGSAGGLLMGATINIAPDLFRAVVAEVPFVDCLTTMLDESLPLTVGEYEEWGDPSSDALAYRTIGSYAPYDNVASSNDDGSDRIYPHLYVTAGLNDSRVGYWEPAKWVLRLRDAHPQNDVVAKFEMGAGHMGPSGRYDAWRDEAEVLAWIVNEIAPNHAE